MSRPSTPLPAGLCRVPLRVRDAEPMGVGRGRLRSADLSRPVRGVRAPAEADLETRCRALLLHRPAGMWFSHLTAARLYGIPLPARCRHDQRIHVCVGAPGRAPQIAGACGHVARDVLPITHRGLPVSSPTELWMELATLLQRNDLVIADDHLVRERLASPELLADTVERGSGRPGIAAARRALPLVRPGSESPGETALRLVLHDAGMPLPELNYRIHGRDGAFVARVDFAYPHRRLVLEYEGDHHRVERGQWHKDIRRQARLEDLGWRVIRVTAADLSDPTDLILRLTPILRNEW